MPDYLAEDEGFAAKMDELHLRKIDLSDEIFVVDLGGYIGESTANEMNYAARQGKPTRKFSEDRIGEIVAEIILRSIKNEAPKTIEAQSP